ncbi:hypothetical protein ABE28_010230 [Peribacillus muralis]|uniref:Uncharacterized protein n=1 Tax=Peribacillus muralis TaxID=264697 RepID=A0A1B3XNF2_9BACI|nr:hypothetical protein ABE28_010230 [Peribacillus muralis]
MQFTLKVTEKYFMWNMPARWMKLNYLYYGRESYFYDIQQNEKLGGNNLIGFSACILEIKGP